MPKRLQARPASLIIHTYPGTPLARENNSSNFHAADARVQFDRGAGGVLGISIAATNGVLQGPDAVMLTMIAGATTSLDQPLMAWLCFLNPESRAKVRIASSDPFATPGKRCATCQ